MSYRLSTALLLLVAAAASAQTVRFETNLGNIDVTMLPSDAPLTVQNFLKYVNRGAYDNSFFHRSVAGFIIQGGGFQFLNNTPVAIPDDGSVQNEYKVSNTRGTIAMAKLGSDPNSATTQWFFNLANNAANLNSQNGGFTVFGRVANASSLAVMDRIAAVPVYNAGAPFDALPLHDYLGGNATTSSLAMVTSVRVLNPAIAENGVISASGYGAYNYAAPGSYIEIYGINLASTARTWSAVDFRDGRAPVLLNNVSVTVGGKPAFVYSIGPTQINVQVPADVEAGEASVVVTVNGQASAPATLNIQPLAGGILAPAAFRVNDKQYAAALHSSGAFVSNGSIPNIAAAPAAPGETLIFYGTGFGPVTGGEMAGQTASGTTPVSTPVEFFFGDWKASVQYAGLAPSYVGLYQFNVIVPAGVSSGDVEVKVLSGGTPVGQSLFLPVGGQ